MNENPQILQPESSDGFGIYIHIPFCKQACHYCDFHFSTSIKKKGELVLALCQELFLRKDEIKGKVETIYFGGGTPSLLSSEELSLVFETIFKNYDVSKNAEITLEANPDDLVDSHLGQSLEENPEENQGPATKLKSLKKAGINRLSIGIQSFYEEDLKLMNRAHNATEALSCIKEAKREFDNISIDLIYGIPGMSDARWKNNLETALALKVPHLSCYALTVEPRTALKRFIDNGVIPPVDEDAAKRHYEILVEETEKAGFDNYEFSNFTKPGFYSRNNTAYWEGKPYLGIGPSAHSFNGLSRSWNVANNTIYIKNITLGKLPSESELLSQENRYNEYIMTGLRTKKGVSLNKVKNDYGKNYSDYLLEQAASHLENNMLLYEDGNLKVSKKGKFLSDGIASDLFWI